MPIDPVLISNLALLGIEALKTYQQVHARLTDISAGKELTVEDLKGFEAQTRGCLDSLKAKIDAAEG